MLPAAMATARPVAIVTGASRGIGRAIAARFARGGYSVWAVARSEPELKTLEDEAEGEVIPRVVDMEAVDAVTAFCAELLREATPPRVLVNNAGVAASAPLAKTSLEELDRILAINTRAPFVLCRELMPAMVQAGGGRVINVASTAALKGFRYTSAYCASKHALLGLTRALAVEFAAKNVTVNAVCPGWTETDMLARSVSNIAKATGRSKEEARKAVAQMNPMGRFVSPMDVAELCWFLASPAASMVTGACYVMDGGEVV